jgi:hypothetical protein
MQASLIGKGLARVHLQTLTLSVPRLLKGTLKNLFNTNLVFLLAPLNPRCPPIVFLKIQTGKVICGEGFDSARLSMSWILPKTVGWVVGLKWAAGVQGSRESLECGGAVSSERHQG